MKQLKTFSKLRGLIVLALALMASGNVSAQTSSARVNGSAYDACITADGETATSATRFYLYNVGTGRFMINSGYWGEYGMTLEQDYGSTLTMNSSYQIDTRMIASSQSDNAHYLGLNVPAITSNGKYGDGSNAFGPIYEANSEYAASSVTSISGTRQWNFVRVETEDDNATTYTYYMYEKFDDGTDDKYYMGVGYGINGANSANQTTIDTWETLSDENMGTMTTEDVTETSHAKKEYYQWRLVTEKELKDLLNADAQEQAESFGGLNADCSYLINAGEFTRNTSTEMNANWTVSSTGDGTDYRYNWRTSSTTSDPWNKAILTLETPYSNYENGKWSFASFEGVGSFYQEIDMTDMPTGWYEISFDAIALGNDASANVTQNVTQASGSTITASTTTYNKATAAGNLAIAQALPDNNHVVTFYYTKDSGKIIINFYKDKATKSSYDYRYRSSSRDSYTYWYHDTDLLAVDNLRMHFIGIEPEVFDEDYTVDKTNNIFDRTFATKTVLLHRTFTTDKWNSLVLPFNMTTAQVKECFGEDVQLAKLNDLKGNLGKNVNGTINFQSVTLGSEGNAIIAGSYYIIKLSKKPDHYKFGTTIDGDYYKVGRREYDGTKLSPLTTELSTEDQRMVAQGTYVQADGIVPSGSYVFSGGNIYHLQSKKDIKGFRYWFNGTEGSGEVKFAIIGAMHDGPEEATSIDGITAEPATVQGVYTINGMKISDDYVGNLPKGLYIINGKKLFVK